MVANASPAIAKATARVLKLSKDERARLIHEYEVMAQRDERARTNDAVATKTLAIARNMLKRNMAVNDIADITGLSLDEIEKLTH